jgi:hypothetical protein
MTVPVKFGQIHLSGNATNQELGNALPSPGTPLIVVYSINPVEL